MSSKKETFGMVTVEGMASGLPIIGSNSGGTPEILEQGKYGKLFEPSNSQSLASVIKTQLNQMTPAKSFSDQLKIAVEKYNYQTVVKEVATILQIN
jgi:glycosyltransferase involved in cell wall biosynthesis